jgi:hypothetical protein
VKDVVVVAAASPRAADFEAEQALMALGQQ